MKMENGKLSTSDPEHMSVFYPHFQRVFNNHQNVDLSMLDLVRQRQIIWDLNDPISWDEFDQTVNKLKNGKAAGLNGILSEAFKAMNGDVRQKVYQYICKFWSGEADYKGWHKCKCVPVPKKGDLSDPNKWRGVMLMDVCSKIFSSIMNERAFVLLDKYGTKFQFGGTQKVGCRDGLFTIKTLLNMQKKHNLASYVAFVDLVKAYGTVNHDLLMQVLARYSAPPKFVSAVECMYKDLIVVLQLGKSVKESFKRLECIKATTWHLLSSCFSQQPLLNHSKLSDMSKALMSSPFKVYNQSRLQKQQRSSQEPHPSAIHVSLSHGPRDLPMPLC